MAYRNQTDHVTIATSERVSGIADLSGRLHCALFLPSSLGTTCYLQVALDTSSASFRRASLLDGSADWSVASFGGPAKAVDLRDTGLSWTHARVEVASAVSAVQSFAFLGKHAN